MADSRMRVWFALFVLAVFCLGGASGIFIGFRMDGPARPGSGRSGPGTGPRGGPGGPPPGVLLERLTRDLDLDESQRQQLGAVLQASRKRVSALQQDVRQQFESEQRRLREEIRKVLTPEQQERFERSFRGRPGRPGR